MDDRPPSPGSPASAGSGDGDRTRLTGRLAAPETRRASVTFLTRQGSYRQHMTSSFQGELNSWRPAVVAREETEERDEAAFSADLLEAMEAAFRVVRALGLSPEETADVLQDASIRAWRHRGKRRGAFRPWFLTIAYREARRPRRRWLTVPAFWVAGDDAGAASASLERVAGALRELPRR